MANRLFYNPLGLLFMFLLAFLVFLAVGLLFMDVLRTAFTRIGFSWAQALILLLASLIGSNVNIPLTTLKSDVPAVRDAYVRVFGVTYRVPIQDTLHNHTVLAVNFGGAVIPVLVSAYLLYLFPASIPFALAGVAVVTVISKIVSKPVKGVGIVAPALVSPLAAALTASALTTFFGSPEPFIFIVAYVAGTLGTLIGADILNLHRISGLGAPVASIGGAGTFDGVFLSGIIAVLLV
ncbi:MAG TPA: DUF1614 domain-containing protein [Methanotrichaceae archaeon]|nr:DUF1614 domain-containing protein [Methanotrichaceae archaeon]